MHRSRHERGIGRAVLGVVLLYALVLQGVLGGAASRVEFRAPGLLCAEHAPQPGDENKGASYDALCCTLACKLALSHHATPAVSVAAPASPTDARERRWFALKVAGPPARASTSANPRAPPVLA